LTALEGAPSSEVAKRLGKQVATVYVARSKVQKFLKEEIAALEAARLADPPQSDPVKYSDSTVSN
jgi:hypothetical protein